MSNISFTKQLIKGKITEIIFESMFRYAGYQIIHFGFEYNLGQLINQDLHTDPNKVILNQVRHSPDFILINPDKIIRMVEVKFRSHPTRSFIYKTSQSLISRWPDSWLFVASHEHFYLDRCQDIEDNQGKINTLDETAIRIEIQNQYLGLLNEFLIPKTSLNPELPPNIT